MSAKSYICSGKSIISSYPDAESTVGHLFHEELKVFFQNLFHTIQKICFLVSANCSEADILAHTGLSTDKTKDAVNN